jgi:rubredoxin---NAD+ reductase
MNPGLIIIGSGLAGYMLAKEWRKCDSHSPLTIITSGTGDFYSKPLLSTALSQQRLPAALPTASVLQMAEQLNAKILTQSSVTAIDPAEKTILVSGEILRYDNLVLAVGADPIKPIISGSGVADLVSVNSLEEYAAFRDKLKPEFRVAVLGAGLVGCEFANDLANVGHAVDVIALCPYPLDRLVTPEIGAVVQDALSMSGVRWYLSQSVDRLDREQERYVLTLNNGQRLEADIVLSAVGLRPHVALAKAAGLRVDRGILVDKFLATSVPSVYALGDCAEVCGCVLQYVAPLLSCSRALAKTLAGELTAVSYPAMPVVLKTPACPLVVSPPPQDLVGEWRMSGEALDRCALFYDTTQQLRGFALTGSMVKERANLQKQLPPIFS